MASNERIRKYLDAGTVLGQVSRGRAEEIVRELVNAGDIQRSQAQEWVDNLVERSRKSSEQVLELVRHEVASQLEQIDPKSLESLANQVAEVLKKSAKAGRSATKDVTAQAGQGRQGRHQEGRQDGQGRDQPGRQDGQGRDHPGRQDGHAGPRRRRQGGPVAPPGVKTPSSPPKSGGKKAHGQEGRRQRRPTAKAVAGRKVDSRSRQARRPRRPPADQRGPPPARRRARATGPRRVTARRPRPPSPPARVLVSGAPAEQGGAPGRPGRAGRPPRTALAVRRPRRPQARCRTGPLRRRGPRPARPRCRGVDRGLHRLPAPARARPTSTPSTSATDSSTPRCGRDPPRDGPRAHQRADAHPGAARRPPTRPSSRARSSSADLSFISLRSVVPALTGPVARRRAPTWSSWSSPSSRRAGPPSPGARASCVTPRLWLGALEGVASALRAAGTGIMGAMASPLTGAAGNVEFLRARPQGRAGSATGTGEATALLAAAVSEADRAPAAGRPGRLSRRSPMATVTFLVHPDRPDALALATDTAAWLTERGDVGPDPAVQRARPRPRGGGRASTWPPSTWPARTVARQHGRRRHLPARRCAWPPAADVPVLGRQLRPARLPARPPAGPGARAR